MLPTIQKGGAEVSDHLPGREQLGPRQQEGRQMPTMRLGLANNPLEYEDPLWPG